MNFRKRPAIWVAEGGFIAMTILFANWGMEKLAFGALTAFATLVHKLVESEEKGEKSNEKGS